MTPEEACKYLDISLDEDLDIEKLKKNYNEKINLHENAEQRAKLDEAYNYLFELYSQLYGTETKSQNHHDNFLIVVALIIAGISALSLAGIFYFVYSRQDNKPVPVIEIANNNNHSNEDYEALRREIEELKKRAENSPPSQNNNTPSYADVIEKCRASMVLIKTNKGIGSGFIVSKNGDILTNYHVIKNAYEINVRTQDGVQINARVKDIDAYNDIALIAITSRSATPFLQISPILPRLGETVIAIGNPKGFIDTVSNGIISGFRTMDNVSLLQFTAPVSPGSSGGALINLNSEVVGMPTLQRQDGQNLNFAVPSTVLNKFLKSAINKPVLNFSPEDCLEYLIATQATLKSNIYTSNSRKTKNFSIPLPDASGFLIHKWRCSIDSIQEYVSEPLKFLGNNAFTTDTFYKAFNAQIDTRVIYRFDNKNKLIAITLVPKLAEYSTFWKIEKEIDNIYGSVSSMWDDGEDGPESPGDNFTSIRFQWIDKEWNNSNITITLFYNKLSPSLFVVFKLIRNNDDIW